MEILLPYEPKRLEKKTSLWQNAGMLAVRKGDEWVPISFDVLDGMVCDHMASHKAVLTRKPYIGYQFPVKECRYVSELYVTGDQKGTELVALPEWFGTGFYEQAFDRDVFVNSASGALGVVNDTTLRVGLDYVTAIESLDPVA